MMWGYNRLLILYIWIFSAVYGTKDISKCRLCKEGHYAIRTCNENHDTICARCPNGSYNDIKNMASSCPPCSTCAVGFFSLKLCTFRHDTICRSCSLNKFSHLLNYKISCSNENYNIQSDQAPTTSLKEESLEMGSGDDVVIEDHNKVVPTVVDDFITVKASVETSTKVPDNVTDDTEGSGGFTIVVPPEHDFETSSEENSTSSSEENSTSRSEEVDENITVYPASKNKTYPGENSTMSSVSVDGNMTVLPEKATETSTKFSSTQNLPLTPFISTSYTSQNASAEQSSTTTQSTFTSKTTKSQVILTTLIISQPTVASTNQPTTPTTQASNTTREHDDKEIIINPSDDSSISSTNQPTTPATTQTSTATLDHDDDKEIIINPSDSFTSTTLATTRLYTTSSRHLDIDDDKSIQLNDTSDNDQDNIDKVLPGNDGGILLLPDESTIIYEPEEEVNIGFAPEPEPTSKPPSARAQSVADMDESDKVTIGVVVGIVIVAAILFFIIGFLVSRYCRKRHTGSFKVVEKPGEDATKNGVPAVTDYKEQPDGGIYDEIGREDVVRLESGKPNGTPKTGDDVYAVPDKRKSGNGSPKIEEQLNKIKFIDETTDDDEIDSKEGDKLLDESDDKSDEKYSSFASIPNGSVKQDKTDTSPDNYVSETTAMLDDQDPPSEFSYDVNSDENAQVGDEDHVQTYSTDSINREEEKGSS